MELLSVSISREERASLEQPDGCTVEDALYSHDPSVRRLRRCGGWETQETIHDPARREEGGALEAFQTATYTFGAAGAMVLVLTSGLKSEELLNGVGELNGRDATPAVIG